MAKKRSGESRVVVSLRPLPPTIHWSEVLDEAIEKQFPTVTASTVMTAKGHNVTVRLRDGSPLMPKLHRAIGNFVQGFLACERSYR